MNLDSSTVAMIFDEMSGVHIQLNRADSGTWKHNIRLSSKKLFSMGTLFSTLAMYTYDLFTYYFVTQFNVSLTIFQ